MHITLRLPYTLITLILFQHLFGQQQKCAQVPVGVCACMWSWKCFYFFIFCMLKREQKNERECFILVTVILHSVSLPDFTGEPNGIEGQTVIELSILYALYSHTCTLIHISVTREDLNYSRKTVLAPHRSMPFFFNLMHANINSQRLRTYAHTCHFYQLTHYLRNFPKHL